MNKKIKIPKDTRLRIYSSLIFSLLIIFSMYLFLYFLGVFAERKEIIFIFSKTGFILIIIFLIPLVYSLFLKSSEKGIKINEEDNEELFEIIKKISGDLNVKIPSKVIILPTADIYVSGFNKKILGLGITTLRAISKKELESILYHEFGHFYGKDTVISSIFSKINISLVSLYNFGKNSIKKSRHPANILLNLYLILFLRCYLFIFNIFTSIYSRQVEYRADYISSKFSGKKTFANALLNYSAYSYYFNKKGSEDIFKLIKEKKSCVNVYKLIYENYKKEDTNKIKEEILKKEKTSLFSSHPTLKERIEKVNIDISSLKIKNKLKNNSNTLFKKIDEEKLSEDLVNSLYFRMVYLDAILREGKCKFCSKQFKTLNDLLKHELICEKKPVENNSS